MELNKQRKLSLLSVFLVSMLWVSISRGAEPTHPEKLARSETIHRPVPRQVIDVAQPSSRSCTAGSHNDQLASNAYLPIHAASGCYAFNHDILAGDRHTVNLNLSIPETIKLSVSEVEISFRKVKRPRSYKARKNVKLSVSTNAYRWKIVCDPTSVQHTDKPNQVIPPERVRWKLKTNGPHKIETSGTLGPGVTLLEGNGPVKDLKIKVSFFLEILPDDLAGNYTLDISLMGMVGF